MALAGCKFCQCPACGKPFIAFQRGAEVSLRMFADAGIDVFYCGAPAACSACGTAVRVPEEETLDLDRDPAGRLMRDLVKDILGGPRS